MKITITPSMAHGIMDAPPSKSMAHRLLICAGLAEGTSVISNVDLSRDIEATIACLQALGARIQYQNGCVTVRGTGRSPAPGTGPAEELLQLPCGESGSTLRFLIPVCLLRSQKTRLTGSPKLFTRPLQIYEQICQARQLTFEKGKQDLVVGGKLTAGEYVIPGNVSSQFISGLLFALPLLDGDSLIRLIPPVESRPYIDMTLQALRRFGIRVSTGEAASGRHNALTSTNGTASALYNVPSFTLHIPGGQKYLPRTGLRVEGDYSNAAFFEALSLLTGKNRGAVPDAQDAQDIHGIQIRGLGEDSLQGDRVYRTYLALLDRGFAQIDLSDCPDLGPVLMAFAAARHGARFTGTRRLRLKESDRGTAMREELAKMGVRVELSKNEITVHPGLRPPREVLHSHSDHRIVMALSVLLTLTGGTIEGAEAVEKSLPDFYERLAGLGIRLTRE